MKIKKYLNTTKKEVEAKKHNIWIGVSLGNKYFTKDNIKQYIEWSLKYTKDKVLVVIADEIYTINLEVLDDRSLKSAHNRALKLGKDKYKEVEEIIELFSNNDKKKINLVRWNDIVSTDYYKKQLILTINEFKTNQKFHDEIISIVKSGRPDRVSKISRLSVEKMDRLAEYVLNEIPHFVNGVQGYDENTYTLIPYPGLSKLDELFVGLNNGEAYSDLSNKLGITNQIAILDAYPN